MGLLNRVDGVSSALSEAVDALSLVDHHCHGVVRGDLDDAAFDALISEGGAAAPGATNFDTPVGLAIRRHCPPVLDLEPHAPPTAYLARRRELGAAEVTRRLLRATRTAHLCVDTGFRPDELTSPEELARLAAAGASHVVRLEAVAEAVIAGGVEPDEFGARYAERLREAVAAVGAVAVKSIAAYRVGFDLDPTPPAAAEVSAAVEAWLRRGPGSNGTWRLDHPVLTRATLAAAVELGLPIQFHVGLGDADIRMHRVDPTLLTDWLHQHRVPVLLLHCWPFLRQASFLAAVHPHVHLDVGLALHYVGPVRAAHVLAEAAELAPFPKLLYSSDAFGVPELFHLGALSFRRALAHLLAGRVEAGEWSETDARRVAELIGSENARRVYRLEPPARGDG